MFKDMNWKPVSAELLGTFFLVFFGVSQFLLIEGFAGVITLGLTLFVLVHTLGPVSGCHLNPVITIPVYLSGKMKQEETIAYVIAQIIGATIGFIAFDAIIDIYEPGNTPSNLELGFVALIGTTFFVASLLTSQDPGSIAATLFIVSITTFGDVNPGVSLGNMLSGNTAWAFYGIGGSFVGCLIGWQIKENIMDD